MESQLFRTTFNEQLRERTMVMAVAIFQIFRSKTITSIEKPLINQLIRSSSSVAANTRAATRARSYAEFYSKICIVVEECDESQFWLDYLSNIGVLSSSEIIELYTEVDKLVGLFSTIKRKMKEKLKSRTQ